MKLIKNIGILSLVILFWGCSGSDGPDTDSPGTTDINSITLSASAANTEVGSSISFTVTANTGARVTSSATIYVNGVAITGSSYTPTDPGNLTATAIYKQLSSNSLVIAVEAKPVTSIEISSDNPWVDLNNAFTFKVEDSNGLDVTDDSKVFVNSFEIDGNTFAPNSYGNYNVYATFSGFTSETITLKAQEGPTSFTKKVLIEDFTGTWCGWCPRVSYGIERVMAETDHAIIAAIHRGSDDPYHFEESNIGALDDGIYPTAKLDRTSIWNFPEPSNVGQVLNLIKNETDLGLSIKAYENNTELEIVVRAAFKADFEGLKYVVYLVEDKLYYHQTNYTQYYNGEDMLLDFEHNNVLRKVLTDIFGDSVPSEDSKTGGAIEQPFSVPIPEPVSNSANLKVIAFLLDASGKVLNVQQTPINSYKNYD